MHEGSLTTLVQFALLLGEAVLKNSERVVVLSVLIIVP